MIAFWTAVQFLTCLPTPALPGDNRHLERSAYLYSFVGLGIGALLAAFNTASHSWLPTPSRIILVLALYAALTGGLHLDGLADTCDGIFGGRDRQRRLEIMRDHRIGTFGVLGLLCTLSLQFTALLELPQSALNTALLLAPGWGRAGIVLAAAVTPPARSEGLGASFVRVVKLRHAVAALVLVCAVSGLISPRLLPWSVLGTIAVTVLLSIYFRIRIGGQTGDTLGATSQIVELLFLWTALLMGSKQ